MNPSAARQRGFAMPALFLAVAVAFIASLGVKGKNDSTVADAIGLSRAEKTEFSVLEKQHTGAPSSPLRRHAQ